MPIVTEYGNTQRINITLDGLQNNVMRASESVDNSTNKYVEVFIGGRIMVSTGNANILGTCDIYAYGSISGNLFTDSASGIDIQHTSMNNLRLVDSVYVTNSGSFHFGPTTLSQAFGGIIPPKWGVVVHNKWGGALNGSDGGQIFYQGLNYTAE